MNNYKVIFDDIPWESPIPGMRFKSYESSGRRLRLVEFTKELKEPDWCRNGHIGYVLNGEIEIDFTGEKIPFKAGDGIFIPAGEQHKHIATVLTETVQLILVEET